MWNNEGHSNYYNFYIDSLLKQNTLFILFMQSTESTIVNIQQELISEHIDTNSKYSLINNLNYMIYYLSSYVCRSINA